MNLGKISLNISPAQQRKFEAALTTEINKKMLVASNLLKTRGLSTVKSILRKYLLSNPTIQEILYGDLAGHFGLPNSGTAVTAIIEQLIDEIHIKSSTKTSVIDGIRQRALFVELYAFIETYSKILGLDVSTIQTNYGPFPWLKHLILDGDKIIIEGWRIQFGDFPRSRSGQAIMIQKEGKIWRVPVEWSGVADKNFITDVVDEAITEIEKAVLKTIEEAF